MLQESCVGEDATARNVVFFRVKWLQPAMKGSSFLMRMQAIRFHVFLVPPMARRFQKCFRFVLRGICLWRSSRGDDVMLW